MGKKKSTSTRRSSCPVACTLDIVGDKWTLLVVRDLALGKRHFEEFLESPEGIASNILTARLRMLQSLGYVAKRTDSDDRRKSIYEFTEQGESLRRLMRYLALWGLKHLPETEVPPEECG